MTKQTVPAAAAGSVETPTPVGGSSSEVQPPSMSHRVQVSKQDLTTPMIAWPTVTLFLGTLLTTVTMHYLVVVGKCSSILAIAILCACAFIQFTPMHDASHLSIAKGKFRWINRVIGRLCSYYFLAPFVAFRYVHLQHHRWTNVDDKDPDLWSGRGPWYFRPLKWLLQEWHYYETYVPLVIRGKRPVGEGLEALATLLVGYGFFIWSVLNAPTLASHIFWFWWIPGRVGVFLLAFTFDYLPHRPHKALDMYRATSGVSLTGTATWPLTVPLLYQNYHQVHHWYPMLPFYQYSRVWFKYRREFMEQGTQIKPLFPIFPKEVVKSG